MQAPLLVLYGSQTGQAQDVAERIGREAKALLFAPRVVPMEAYDVRQLPGEHSVVFVLSTAGQGQFPDNAQSFWKFLLRKSLPPDSLSGLQYAVFGLGDSGYPKYNVAAKKLERRLAGLGGTALLPLGLGDDQHPSGYEAALDPWLLKAWAALRAAQPLPEGMPQPVLDASTLVQLGQPRYNVRLLPSASSTPATTTVTGAAAATMAATPEVASEQVACLQPGSIPCSGASELLELVAVAAAFRRVAAQASGSHSQGAPGGAPGSSPVCAATGAASGAASRYGPWWPFPAPVLVNRRLTSASHTQDVRHIEVSLEGSGMEDYAPGDLLTVWPRPETAAVDAFLQRMGWDGSQVVEVTSSEPLPQGQQAEVARGTLRAFAEAVLDVAGASPRRRFFQVLAQHTPETAELERDRLQYFASAEGRDDLYRYNQREGRSLLEVLQDFKSCTPPLEWLLEAAPLLKPRQFSISSSPRMHPGHAHLTVAVVNWTTPYKRPRRGLCSTYLATRRPKQADAGSHVANGSAAVNGGGEGAGNLAAGTDTQHWCTAQGHDCLAVWVEQGSMKMPASLATPLVLVGPGTGIAPFRGFLEDRAARLQHAQHASADAAAAANGATEAVVELAPAPCCLFVGCRKLQGDAYYLEQWQEYQRLGVLVQRSHGLSVAASQDQPQKVYVTHNIRLYGAELWQLITQQGAVVCVSGSAQKMPSDVAAAFEDVAQQHGGMSREQAAQYVRQMELQGRYLVEAWS